MYDAPGNLCFILGLPTSIAAPYVRVLQHNVARGVIVLGASEMYQRRGYWQKREAVRVPYAAVAEVQG